MSFIKKLFSTKTAEKIRPFTSAVIVAAGSSRRMSGEDKIFSSLQGVPVLVHSLRAFEVCPLVDEIIVVTRPECIANIGEICKIYALNKVKCVLRGGETRQQSVFIGIMEVSTDAELVAIHDGARPLVTQKIITETIRTADEFGCAIPAVRVKDTIKTVNDDKVSKTLDREQLYAAQTPQIFKTELIKAALTQAINKNIEITDDSMAVELIGASIRIVDGSQENIKITFPVDLLTAEAIIERREVYGQ